MNQNQPPANWYPDPDSSSYLRYWDGNAWTEHRTPLIQPVAKRTFKTGTTKISRILVPVSIVLWVAALWFVAYYPVVSRAGLSNDGITTGSEAFLGGAVYFWFPFGPWIAWWGNIIMLLALLIWVFGKAPNLRTMIAGVGVMVSAIAFGFRNMPINEAGDSYQQNIGPATYIWFLSILIMFVAVLLRPSKKRLLVSATPVGTREGETTLGETPRVW